MSLRGSSIARRAQRYAAEAVVKLWRALAKLRPFKHPAAVIGETMRGSHESTDDPYTRGVWPTIIVFANIVFLAVIILWDRPFIAGVIAILLYSTWPSMTTFATAANRALEREGLSPLFEARD